MITCNICNRKCNIDRDKNVGYCKSTRKIKIAKTMIHHWEEPIISGTNGSGAIFFSNCNLRCVYCQNYQISHLGNGEEISPSELAIKFRELENIGVHNINLVTPTHYLEEIIEALNIYKPKIPIIWNTNSYESSDTIIKLINYVDIFLFDLKYFNNNISKKYSDVNNYFKIATENIILARKLIGKDKLKNNLLQKGLIVRHLVLPNNLNDSVKILEWISENIPSTIISLMSQYTPTHITSEYPEINRKLSKLEYKYIVSKFLSLKLNGYIQELSSADTNYIPDFNQH